MNRALSLVASAAEVPPLWLDIDAVPVDTLPRVGLALAIAASTAPVVASLALAATCVGISPLAVGITVLLPALLLAVPDRSPVWTWGPLAA